MGTITLTLPSSGTVVTAGLHSTNYTTLQTVINGNLDNNNIAVAAGIAQSKLAFDPYTTYTPTWTSSGVAPAIGNATVFARYVQIGKLVHAYGKIVFGTTSTYGTGNYRLALPVTANSNAENLGIGLIYDVSANAQGTTNIQANSTTTVRFTFGATYLGNGVEAAQTIPWTWATGDIVEWNIVYEAA